jgi:hypothetical protein
METTNPNEGFCNRRKKYFAAMGSASALLTPFFSFLNANYGKK